MTEIEIETYSSDSYSEEDEIEYLLITPDDSMPQAKDKQLNSSNDSSFSQTQDETESVSNSFQNDESFSSKKSNFSQFIKRQNAANKRQIKNRDNPPTERRFNPPPFKFILKSAIPPQKAETHNSSKQYPSLFQRSVNQSNHNSLLKKSNEDKSALFENMYDSSFLSDDFKKFEQIKIGQNSELIATEKNSMIIKNTCGNQDVINLFQLRRILSHFFIKDILLISEICSMTCIKPVDLNSSLDEKKESIYKNRIDQNEGEEIELYDNRILKKLLIHSINEEKIKNLSNLEIKIRSCISASFRNDKNLSKKEKI